MEVIIINLIITNFMYAVCKNACGGIGLDSGKQYKLDRNSIVQSYGNVYVDVYDGDNFVCKCSILRFIDINIMNEFIISG